MGSRKSPLAATISGVALSLNGVDSATQAINIPLYRGENLYCHVVKQGNVLMITVDGTDANDNQAPAGATQALITINYRGVYVPPINFLNIAYVANMPINPRMVLNTDLTNAQLIIADQPAKLPVNAVRLEFVLVYEETPPQPRYRLEWIRNSVMVDFAEYRTEASVVAPSSAVGGAMGPMGLTTP
jgi:hypothetical protein